VLFFKTKEVHNADYPFDVKDCDIVTFHFCKNKIEPTDFTLIKEHVTSIIDITQSTEQLWSNIKESGRRQINKAKKENIQIERNTNYDEFYAIYRTFLKQKGYTTFHGLFNTLQIGAISKKIMKQNGTLYTAKHKNEVITGILFLESKTSIHAWIGASKRLSADKEKASRIGRAQRLIIWTALQDAKQKEIQEFDFEGIFSDDEVQKDPQKQGIREFKMRFGGQKVTRYQYQKIYSKFLRMALKIKQR
jgi:lipid II:glycine glycyltransferase (peptidoglycan interpeptide bridge formation enzyme)